MKYKLLLILLSFQFVLCFSQDKRFSYTYQFVPNKDLPDDIKVELMALEVSEKGSQFFSQTVQKSDSILFANLELQLKTTGSITVKKDTGSGSVRYQVSKTYPKYETFLHTRLGMDRYKVLEERPIKWTIKNDKKTIGEWQVQKAETNFAGRQWIAWFCEDIPIQDGPYKFSGLPGLIIQISDESQSHQFELNGIINIEKFTDKVFNSKEVPISQKQYIKALNDYENDPTKGMKQMMMGNVLMKMDNSVNMKEEENNVKSKIAKDNNRIELVINN